MKINKFFSFLLGGALLAGAVACTDEVDYTPAKEIAGNGVYFPEIASTDVEIKQNTSEVEVSLMRTYDTALLNVGLTSTVTDSKGNAVASPFNIPTQVSFPQGTKEAVIPITYNFGDIEPEFNYYVTLKIEGEETTPYGRVEQTYVLRYSPWSEFELYNKSTEPAVVTYSLFGISDREVPVYESKSLIGSGFRYRLGDYGELPEEDEDMEVSFVNGNNMYLTVEKDPIPASWAGEANRLYPAHMEIFASGDDQSFGAMLYTTDAYTYHTQVNSSDFAQYDDDIIRYNSYYDSFTGQFTIMTVWYYNDAMYTSTKEYFQLPGFKDYGIEFSYNGNFVTSKGQEMAIVEAHRTDDVASFSYTISQGTLSEAQVKAEVEAIKANTDAELIYDALINLQFSLTEGNYTIVAVGYDGAGDAVCDTYYNFTYKSVQVASDWESIGEVDYRDGIVYGYFQFNDGSMLGGNSYKVELQKHKTQANYFRIVNPCGYYYDYGVIADGDYYLAFYTSSDLKYAIVEDSYVGVDPSAIGNTNGQWIISSPVSGLLAQATVDEIAAVYPEYVGVIDADGYLQFPAGFLTRHQENTGMERGWLCNYNEAMIEAMENDTFDQDQLLTHDYGMGLFSLDMYDVINPARVSSKANRAPKGFKAANGTGALKAAKSTEASAKGLTMAGSSRKAAAKSNIRGTKVEGKTLLRNGMKADLSNLRR